MRRSAVCLLLAVVAGGCHLHRPVTSSTSAAGPISPQPQVATAGWGDANIILQTAKDPRQLLPLLTNENPVIRRAASAKLGSLRNPTAVPHLAQLIRKEKPLPALGTNTPTTAALQALGHIGGQEAKTVVVGAVTARLHQGPSDHQYIYRDEGYYGVVYYGVTALGTWSSDSDVAALLDSLATESKWYGRIDSAIQQKAWETILARRASEARATSAPQRTRFLLGQLTGTGVGHKSDWAKPGFKTPEAARNSALMGLLSATGPSILPEVSRQEHTTTDPGRREALKRLRARIAARQTMGEPIYNAPDK